MVKVYLAYSEGHHGLLVKSKARLIVSYGRKHGDPGSPYLPPDFEDVLIDSGGFQMAMGTAQRGVYIKAYTLWLQLLIEKYGELGKGGIISGYMGLDTKSWEETLDNYEYMRKEGLVPVPVWKAWWPEQMLDFLCSEYEWIAVGGVAFTASKDTLRHVFERVAITYPKTRVHMLGVGVRAGTSFKSFRPYSIDVSTWTAPVRFGMTIVLDKKQVLRETSLPTELRQKVKVDLKYRDEVLLEAIKTLQSLETVMNEYNEPYQQILF